MTARLAPAFLAAALLAAASPAAAEKIANRVAVFSGLDKITGRIITFDVYIDETVQFGALRVTPRVCYSRPPTEAAQTDGFVEVEEITLDSSIKKIFSGWMFAASPGLNAVEHPVFDVWLTDCRMESDVPPPGERTAEAREAQANAPTPAAGEGEQAAAPGVEMIDGIPIPRRKPPVPASAGSDLPNAPEDPPPSEILD